MTEEYKGIVLLAGAFVLILIAVIVGRKAEWLLDVMLRCVLGTIAMYFINGILEKNGIVLCVGINPLTVLTSGILGFPGLLAVYGIGFYKTL